MYEICDVDRLNFLVAGIYTFLLGFISMLFIIAVQSLYLSIPYGFRCKSKTCCKLKDGFNFYILVYLFMYFIVFLFCVFLSVNGVVFIAVTLIVLIAICMRLKKISDDLQFNKIMNELNAYVISFGRYLPISSECNGMRNDEHNPATGLPMVGGVDVAGNPYGYEQHK